MELHNGFLTRKGIFIRLCNNNNNTKSAENEKLSIITGVNDLKGDEYNCLDIFHLGEIHQQYFSAILISDFQGLSISAL